MQLAIQLIVSLLAAGVFWFLVRTYSSIMARNKLSKLELHQLEVEEAYDEKDKVRLRQRLADYAVRQGYQGSALPITLALAFVFAVVAFGLNIAGLPQAIAIPVAIPVTVVVVMLIVSTIAQQRRKVFSKQLLDALRLMANSLESGKGVNQSLEQAVGASENPFRSELTAALSTNLATKNLIEALKPVGRRYPSKAWDLFMSALEVDQLIGGTLSPALRQAAELLQEEFTLQAKSQTLLASAKMAFWVVLGVIVVVAWVMINGMGDFAKGSYSNPVAVIALVAVFGNFLFGVYRVLRVFNTAGGKF